MPYQGHIADRGRCRIAAWFVAVGTGLWLGWACPAYAAPSVKWRVPDATDRVLFECSDPESEDCQLVALPLDKDAVGPAGVVAMDPSGVLLPVHQVYSGAGLAWVLVKIPGSERQDRVFSVYYGGKVVTNDATMPATVSKSPVLSKLFRGAGKGIPNTLDKLIFMLANQTVPVAEAREKSLGSVPEEIDQEDDSSNRFGPRRPRKERSNLVMIHNRSMVLFPKDGIYRLAIDCEDAGAIFVDEQYAVEWLGGHPSGKWKEGVPLFLRAGPHRVEVRCVFDLNGKMKVGWRTPESTSIEQLPYEALLTSAEATVFRHERIGKTLHAGFTMAAQPAYKFKGNPILFVPVRFMDRSDNWLSVEVKRRWSFPGMKSTMGLTFSSDASLSAGTLVKEESSIIHVFKGADLFRARLDLRDDLGFTDSVEKEVDCRMKPFTEYVASAWLDRVPSACFEGDKVKPVMRLDGFAPSWARFTLGATIRNRAGEGARMAVDRPLTVAVREPIADSIPAGQIVEIGWSCEHEGAFLASGRVRFLRYPFVDMPVSAEEDRLYDRHGVQLALVTTRSSGTYRQDKIMFRPREDRLAWLDDSLCGVSAVDPRKEGLSKVLARVTGIDNERLILRRVEAWGASTDQYGGINAILAAGKLAETDAVLVIVSLGFQDLVHGTPIEEFERRLAVIVDLLASRKKKVLLVTPLPSSGEEPDVRAFASAIRLTADARSIPVADLYSAFMGMQKAQLWEQGGMELSEEGTRLAAQILAKAMARE